MFAVSLRATRRAADRLDLGLGIIIASVPMSLVLIAGGILMLLQVLS